MLTDFIECGYFIALTKSIATGDQLYTDCMRTVMSSHLNEGWDDYEFLIIAINIFKRLSSHT